MLISMDRAIFYLAFFSAKTESGCQGGSVFLGKMSDEDKELKNEISALGSWDSVKAAYINTGRKIEMQNSIDFRQRYVLGLLHEIKNSGLNVSWPTYIPGSRTLTSDFDVPIWVPEKAEAEQWGGDVKAAQRFSACVIVDFGVSPSSIFDTNIYVKDFSSSSGETSIYDKSNQAVAALTKVRRYMSAVNWDSFMKTIRTYKAPFLRKRTIGAPIDAQTLQTQKEAMERFEQSARNFDELDTLYAQYQLRLRKKLLSPSTHFMERIKKDKTWHQRILDAEYALYLESMEEVRFMQIKLMALDADADIRLKVSEIKRKTSEAVFFAPEAYSSEGAFWHIVEYDQAGRKKKVLETLTHFDLFCSAIEQAGDFLKDVDFHFKDDPTTALYQSAKYLTRFYDAIDLLIQKINEVGSSAPRDAILADYMVMLDRANKELEKSDVFLVALKELFEVRKSGDTKGVKDARALQIVDTDEFRRLFGEGIAGLRTTVLKHLAKLITEYQTLFTLHPP